MEATSTCGVCGSKVRWEMADEVRLVDAKGDLHVCGAKGPEPKDEPKEDAQQTPVEPKKGSRG